MKKARTHTLKITVTFDKACTPAHAAREARDCIHGEFYPFQRDTRSDPGIFKVKTIGRIPKAPRR
jgi:hypothetical protein